MCRPQRESRHHDTLQPVPAGRRRVRRRVRRGTWQGPAAPPQGHPPCAAHRSAVRPRPGGDVVDWLAARQHLCGAHRCLRSLGGLPAACRRWRQDAVGGGAPGQRRRRGGRRGRGIGSRIAATRRRTVGVLLAAVVATGAGGSSSGRRHSCVACRCGSAAALLVEPHPGPLPLTSMPARKVVWLAAVRSWPRSGSAG